MSGSHYAAGRRRNSGPRDMTAARVFVVSGAPGGPGGGAAAPGAAGVFPNTSGPGGAGLMSDISGVNLDYGSRRRRWRRCPAARAAPAGGPGAGAGGSGGPGHDALPNRLAAAAAGAGATNGRGGLGGSGCFIYRYSGGPQFTGGAITTVGGDTVHTFTANGSLIPA